MVHSLISVAELINTYFYHEHNIETVHIKNSMTTFVHLPSFPAHRQPSLLVIELLLKHRSSLTLLRYYSFT